MSLRIGLPSRTLFHQLLYVSMRRPRLAMVCTLIFEHLFLAPPDTKSNNRDSCLPRLPLGLLYFRWKIGRGRTARQPGQVRKEAAVTSFVRVACPVFRSPGNQLPGTTCQKIRQIRTNLRRRRARLQTPATRFSPENTGQPIFPV